jgi:hypothetical protein
MRPSIHWRIRAMMPHTTRGSTENVVVDYNPSYTTVSLRTVHVWQDPDSCLPFVTEAEVSPTSKDSWGNLVNEMNAQGSNLPDRFSLMFLDNTSASVCGQGSLDRDDSPVRTTRTSLSPLRGVIWLPTGTLRQTGS